MHQKYSFSMMDMPRGRYGHSCGLVVDPENGPEVIVMGGRDFVDSVDIYNVNYDAWREGKMTQNYSHFAT